MFTLIDYKNENRSSDKLVILSGLAAFLDTTIGVVINLGLLAFGMRQPLELLWGISLLLGFPMFLLDLRLNQRFAFCLSSLFLFRWAILSFDGGTLVLGNPFAWPVGALLGLSFALLQWSKLRSTSARAITNPGRRAP
jgi:hypothetical protein